MYIPNLNLTEWQSAQKQVSESSLWKPVKHGSSPVNHNSSSRGWMDDGSSRNRSVEKHV